MRLEIHVLSDSPVDRCSSEGSIDGTGEARINLQERADKGRAFRNGVASSKDRNHDVGLDPA